jgi:N-acetylglucosamine-6-phosphate deacetylase
LTLLDVAALWTPSGIDGPTTVQIEDGTIRSVGPATGDVVDVLLAPGFIDVQVNGVDDVDVWTAADDGDWRRLDRLLASQGVTSWCPTLVTAPKARYAARLRELSRARELPGARPAMLGAHLEGPFLGSKAGAHNPEFIVAPDPDWLVDFSDGSIAIVTMGAENCASPAATEALTAVGITVSLGHTAPTSSQAQAAFDAGARMVTHIYNATDRPAAREPGLVGTALMTSGVRVGLIADLVHVHPTMIRMAFDLKGADGVVLVSDSIAWRAGTFDGRPIEIRNGAPWLEDGRLAGSCLSIPRAISNLVEHCDIPLQAAIAAATSTPAAALGMTDRGNIGLGLRADLVALDRHTLEPVATWARGEQCWGSPWDAQPLSRRIDDIKSPGYAEENVY